MHLSLETPTTLGRHGWGIKLGLHFHLGPRGWEIRSVLSTSKNEGDWAQASDHLG